MRLRNLKSPTNEGMFDSLKSFASKAVDKVTDASGEGEKQQYIKDFQAKYARWVTQTQPAGTNPADIDIIIKYLKTQMRLTDADLKGVYQIAGIQAPAAPVAAPAEEPAKPAAPDYSMFKDANKFKAEWDKFVSQNGNYKLIADPRMLEVLKGIWMRTGGTKLESILRLGTKLSGKELFSINKLLESNGVTLETLGFRSTRTNGSFIIKEALPPKATRKPIPGLARAKQQQSDQSGEPTPTDQPAAQQAGQTAADAQNDRIEPTMDRPAATPAATPPAAPAAAPAQPVVAPAAAPTGDTVFADWKKFRDMWEGFQEADGSMAPAVRGVIKDILLTALKTVESIRNNKRIVAEGTVLDVGKIGQIWAEVVRTLYDSGKIQSNPANNPLNKVGAFVAAAAGKKAIDTSGSASTHKNSGTTNTTVASGDYNSVIAGLADLTPEEKKAATDAINSIRGTQ